MQSIKVKWEDGKDFEVDFWAKWVETKGGEWSEDFKNRMNPDLLIEPHIENFLSGLNEINILDVGAGPLTVLGKKLSDGRTVTIVPVDPLADEYNDLFKKNNITPIVSTSVAEVEKLDEKFEDNTFDLVHMRNALDHSYDPLLGVKQMLKVVNKNRVVLLEHSTNEAEKAHYGAFHQWNICMKGNDLFFWNKESEINVTKELSGIAKVVAWGDDDWTSAVIEKL